MKISVYIQYIFLLAVVKTSESNAEKEADIKLSVFIANHSSIRCIDHLGELLAKIGKGSSLEELELHRTKCSSIILNVVAPELCVQLREEIGNNAYSIILDESTDVSGNEKSMAYCIRYYNARLERVVVDFLGFQSVFKATADVLFENFLQFIAQIGLDLNKMIALATDGASNLCGSNHSLYTLLKQRLPKLLLFKCICHSLNLCAQKAAQELPSHLDFLLTESRNWFSHSVLRMKRYEAHYKQLNVGKTPPKLVQLSNTRWLAFHGAIASTLMQWDDLKQHFTNVSRSSDRSENNCYMARLLSNMFTDNSNYLYLLFLNSVIKEVNTINLAFQSNNADIIQLYVDLRTLLVNLAKRVFKQSFLNTKSKTPIDEEIVLQIKHAVEAGEKEFGSSLLDLNDCDFGDDFKDCLEQYNHNIKSGDLVLLKIRCRKFLLKICQELVERFPSNISVIGKLRYFKPKTFMKKKDLSPNDLPWELNENQKDKAAIEAQFRKLRALNFEDISDDETDFQDPMKFWVVVSKMKNAVGSPAFAELCSFAFRALSLPISNAVVERVFSILNVVKTKLRNRLGFKMTNALLIIRTFLDARKLCCKNFKVSEGMLQRHNKNMYLRAVEDNTENIDELEILNELAGVLDESNGAEIEDGNQIDEETL